MRPEVWAPRAASVDVVLVDGSREPMEPVGDGWYRGTADLEPATDYWFALDGGDERFPDPRSHSQPDGIDGPSAVVDHRSFPWTDGGWHGFHLPGSVLYELHVGTFSPTGDFDGAIERLDHLVDLGVDAVEVMPVAEAMGERGWGYDGVLLYAVHHAYGGPDAFKRFVDACHGRGLGVLLDVVYNHLGPKGNHLGRFGPYFTDAHSTPWGDAVNLDGEGSDAVRRFILDNARHWFLDHHVDGLRLDAVHALVDDSPVHVVAELRAEVDALAAHLRRPLWLVAEREQDELLPVLAPEAGGWGLDAKWADDLHHALHAALTGERRSYYERFGRISDVVDAVERPHDPHPVPNHRFVTCDQNHDQVGNRAGGERLAHLAGVDAQLLAATVVLCAPGTPMLFQGEEWATSSPFPYFCDCAGDEELATAIREGRLKEFAGFGWPADAVLDATEPETFRRAQLPWDELDEAPHDAVLAFYRELVQLRRRRPDLRDGRRSTCSFAVDEEARTLVLRRAAIVVVANLADGPRHLDVAGEVLLANGAVAVGEDGIELGPMAVAVLDG